MASRKPPVTAKRKRKVNRRLVNVAKKRTVETVEKYYGSRARARIMKKSIGLYVQKGISFALNHLGIDDPKLRTTIYRLWQAAPESFPTRRSSGTLQNWELQRELRMIALLGSESRFQEFQDLFREFFYEVAKKRDPAAALLKGNPPTEGFKA